MSASRDLPSLMANILGANAAEEMRSFSARPVALPAPFDIQARVVEHDRSSQTTFEAPPCDRESRCFSVVFWQPLQWLRNQRARFQLCCPGRSNSPCANNGC